MSAEASHSWTSVHLGFYRFSFARNIAQACTKAEVCMKSEDGSHVKFEAQIIVVSLPFGASSPPSL